MSTIVHTATYDIERVARKQAKLEALTNKIDTKRKWNSNHEGSQAVIFASSSSIYDCIAEACGVDTARSFFNHF